MDIKSYRLQLEQLENRLQQFRAAYYNTESTIVKLTLEEEIKKLEEEINRIGSVQVYKRPQLSIFSVSPSAQELKVGDTLQLSVLALCTDGSTKVVNLDPEITYSLEFDPTANNGMILSVDTSEYKGGYETLLTITYSDRGFLFFVEEGRPFRAEKEAENWYLLHSLGIRFVTDGKEQVGDTWKIRVRKSYNDIYFRSFDDTVAKVDYQNGLVTAVSPGSTEISVGTDYFTALDSNIRVKVTVVESDAPSSTTNTN